MTYLIRSMIQVAIIFCSCVAVYKLASREIQEQTQEVIMPESVTKDTAHFQLFDENGIPCADLQKILALAGVQHENNIASVLNVTQKNFLRPAGKERWEVSDVQYKAVEKELVPLFNKLELIETLEPARKHYDYVLWMGSLLASVEKRLLFLKELWDQGLRFDNLVVLTGERVLQPEEQAALRVSSQKSITSEPEMMQWVYENSYLPEEMRKIPVTIIASLAAPGAYRATTPDTVRDWLKTNPVPGTVLVISSQPYTHYQAAVVREYLPSSFSIDSAGKAASPNTPVTTYLDNIARWVYQENQIIKRKGQVKL